MKNVNYITPNDTSSRTNSPLVTVAILTYKRYDQLHSCLQNILNQTYENIEILISDNSEDTLVPDWINAIQRNDKRVRYVKHKYNLGMYGNDYYVRQSALGEYLCVIHDDDIVPTNYIKILMNEMLTSPNVTLVGPACQRYYEGEYWYQYENYNSNKVNKTAKIHDIVWRAFNNSSSFEHLVHGVYRKSDLDRSFKFGRWRSIITFFYLLSLKGEVRTVESIVMVKNTTQRDLEKYEEANYISRYKIFNMFFPRIMRPLEERMTVLYRLIKFTIINRDLSKLKKIYFCFFAIICFSLSLVSVCFRKVHKLSLMGTK